MRATRLALVLLVAALVVPCGTLAAAASGQPAGTVVMSGLDNPRGLTFVRAGDFDEDEHHGHKGRNLRGWALYVAEAGRGGGPGATHCITLPRGPTGVPACPGATGAVSRLLGGVQERVLTGLPSWALPDGSEATGPMDVSFSNRRRGYVTIGLGAENVSLRPALGNGFGWIVRFRPDGSWSYDVDVTAYEIAANPDGGILDSNPNGLLAGAGRRFVVDSGGNTLLSVGRDGISTVAVFPSRAQGRSTDSVPTAVARGRGGTLYVGELTGVPFAAGAANVYRVRPGGGAPEVVATGFTTIIDLDVDRAGNLYVLEHSSGPVFFGGTGTLWRIDRSGNREALVTGLSRPTSVVIGPDGAAYISNRGVSVGTGEVLRFDISAHVRGGEDEQDEQDEDDDDKDDGEDDG
jgi:sugar lactone lactonase YvrE